jgi:hypothetical protein
MYHYRLFFSHPPNDEPVRRVPQSRGEPLRVHRLPGREAHEARNGRVAR